jgi:methylated-DNA-[protein]-cysteine S-methyltransferase/AraC family transcriptional regulator of adaptative response/methylated-DNA-[protein]-cysteine methyltransferase
MNFITTDFISRVAAGKTRLDAAHEIAFAIGECALDIGECALDKVLVARSTMGVCAILFGTTAEELEQDLETIFPESTVIRNERRLRDDLSKVLRFLATPHGELDLDLDIRGTPFQRRVWIAQACSENPIALAVPCHRVMGNSASMAGYRWGIKRKQALINREITAAA